MHAYLRPLVSCRLYYDNHQTKKDLGEIEKTEKYSEMNVYVEIVYNSLCVCVCVWIIFAYYCV